MSLVGEMIAGLQAFLDWHLLLYLLLGTLNGALTGLLPGLNGSVGIALMIPLTFNMTAIEAMVLFIGALGGQNFTGSIGSILLNTPGSSVSAATTLDGYPLARQGKGGLAIGVSATSSALGSALGIVALILLFSLTRQMILAFSFAEFTLMAFLGICVIAVASQESLLKGLIAGGIGLMLSFVGFDPFSGQLRYVFGIPALWDGIDLVAALIGLFALAEVMRLLVKDETVAQDVEAVRFSRQQVWEGVRFVFTQPYLFLRSALIGVVTGIVPGVGGTVAAFLAYFQAVHTSKDPERFGKGDPRGVLAPEAANDAKDAGAALPTLAFGIPGSADWAIVLGGMLLHGINPGPNLIREHPDLIWVSIWVILFASWLTSIAGLCTATSLVQITRIRPSLLAPIVGVLGIVGAYSLNRQMIDVAWAIGFGILGYYMKEYRVPLVPVILGLLLGDLAERSFHQALAVSDIGIWIFVTRPISFILLVLCLLVLLTPVFVGFRHKKGRGLHV